MNNETFLEHIDNLLPEYYQDELNQREIFQMFAMIFDVIMQMTDESVQLPWIKLEHNPDDALKSIGYQRNITKVTSETNPQFRARLIDAFNTWGVQGSEDAIERTIKGIGITDCKVLPAFVDTAVWDVTLGFQFSVACYLDPPVVDYAVPVYYGDENTYYGQNGLIYGAPISEIITRQQLIDIRTLVKKWKPVDFIARELIFIAGPTNPLPSATQLSDLTSLGANYKIQRFAAWAEGI